MRASLGKRQAKLLIYSALADEWWNRKEYRVSKISLPLFPLDIMEKCGTWLVDKLYEKGYVVRHE